MAFQTYTVSILDPRSTYSLSFSSVAKKTYTFKLRIIHIRTSPTSMGLFTLEVPNQYGWVVLGAGIGSVLTNMVLSGPVMKARSEMNIPYPT
jgi:hypothetical protein